MSSNYDSAVQIEVDVANTFLCHKGTHQSTHYQQLSDLPKIVFKALKLTPVLSGVGTNERRLPLNNKTQHG